MFSDERGRLHDENMTFMNLTGQMAAKLTYYATAAFGLTKTTFNTV